jgi:hypothetical protein
MPKACMEDSRLGIGGCQLKKRIKKNVRGIPSNMANRKPQQDVLLGDVAPALGTPQSESLVECLRAPKIIAQRNG